MSTTHYHGAEVFSSAPLTSDIYIKNQPTISGDIPNLYSETPPEITMLILEALLKLKADKDLLFSGSYSDLKDKPSLFSGDYNDLVNKPSLFTGNYNDLSNKPSLDLFITKGEEITRLLDQTFLNKGFTNELINSLNNYSVINKIPGSDIILIQTKDNVYYTYESSTQDNKFYILGTQLGSFTPSSPVRGNYFMVSKEGLLQANNAIIRGTVYASEGEFTGIVHANQLTLGGGKSYNNWDTLKEDLRLSQQEIDDLFDSKLEDVYTKTNQLSLSITNMSQDRINNLVTKGELSEYSKVSCSNVNGITSININGTIYNTISKSSYDNQMMVFGTMDPYNHSTKYFAVDRDGLLTANNAVIYGSIHASTGTIGNWNITPNGIQSISNKADNANELANEAKTLASEAKELINEIDIESELKELGVLNSNGEVNYPNLSNYLTSDNVDSNLIVSWLGKGTKPNLTTYVSPTSIVTDSSLANTVFAGKVNASSILIGSNNSRVFIDGGNGTVRLGSNVTISWDNSWNTKIPTKVSQLEDSSNYALKSELPTDVDALREQLEGYNSLILAAQLAADAATTAATNALNAANSISGTIGLDTVLANTQSVTTNLSDFFGKYGEDALYTYIDKDKVVTETAIAKIVDADYVNALNITANSVSTNWVYSGIIKANLIDVTNGKISAGQIDVDSLSVNKINGKDVKNMFTEANTLGGGYLGNWTIRKDGLRNISNNLFTSLESGKLLIGTSNDRNNKGFIKLDQSGLTIYSNSETDTSSIAIDDITLINNAYLNDTELYFTKDLNLNYKYVYATLPEGASESDFTKRLPNISDATSAIQYYLNYDNTDVIDSIKGKLAIQLKANGTGSLAYGNISWDNEGNTTFNGTINANSGNIGEWKVNKSGIQKYNTSDNLFTSIEGGKILTGKKITLDLDHDDPKYGFVKLDESGLTIYGRSSFSEGSSIGDVTNLIQYYLDETELYILNDLNSGIDYYTLTSPSTQLLSKYSKRKATIDDITYLTNRYLTGRLSEIIGNISALFNVDGTGLLAGGNIGWDNDGSGWLANKNIIWDASGNSKFNGEINTVSGNIGGWNINSDGLVLKSYKRPSNGITPGTWTTTEIQNPSDTCTISLLPKSTYDISGFGYNVDAPGCINIETNSSKISLNSTGLRCYDSDKSVAYGVSSSGINFANLIQIIDNSIIVLGDVDNNNFITIYNDEGIAVNGETTYTGDVIIKDTKLYNASGTKELTCINGFLVEKA